MKKTFLLFALILTGIIGFSQNSKHTALLIVDIQDFYFPGGQLPLVEPEAATDNAALLLASFRKNGQIVVHVKHQAKTGDDIRKKVEPLTTEKVITKDDVNSFLQTDLQEYLQKNSIDTLVICGMQTHMCAEGATRAAHDLGYVCYFVEDACATRDLKYGEYVIKAEDVHKSTLATLQAYAKILTTKDFLTNRK
jgi:nicotinamidase-related amidase